MPQVPVVTAAAVREVNALLEKQHDLLIDIAATAQSVKDVTVATSAATAEVCVNVERAIQQNQTLIDLSLPHAHGGGPPENDDVRLFDVN